jgi:hypothetical protein
LQFQLYGIPTPKLFALSDYCLFVSLALILITGTFYPNIILILYIFNITMFFRYFKLKRSRCVTPTDIKRY